MITAATLPSATAIALAMTIAFVVARSARRKITIDPAGLRMLGTITAGLAAVPFLFVTLGFIAAATLLFTLTATALRARQTRATDVAIDIVVGTIFSVALFLVFTRGLGVSLPGPSL